MRKVLTIIALLNASLCLLLPLLLAWGYPLGMNRLCFKDFREHYPGPISLTVSSFPYGVYCQELYDNDSFKVTYRYHNLDNDAVVIPWVLYNRDTLVVKCGKEGIDSVSFYRITNPIKGNECENVQLRIEQLRVQPMVTDLLERGYTMKVFHWKRAVTSYFLEPIVILFILLLSLAFVLLFVFQYGCHRL